MTLQKPLDFWEKVARAVSNDAHEINSDVPTWDGLDPDSRKAVICICQLAVKHTARIGRALLPYEPEPCEKPKP